MDLVSVVCETTWNCAFQCSAAQNLILYSIDYVCIWIPRSGLFYHSWEQYNNKWSETKWYQGPSPIIFCQIAWATFESTREKFTFTYEHIFSSYFICMNDTFVSGSKCINPRGFPFRFSCIYITRLIFLMFGILVHQPLSRQEPVWRSNI